MKQFIITTPIINSATEISGEDYHYLVDVLRLEEGDSFRGLLPHSGGSDASCGNGTSCEAIISIVKISRKKRRCLVHIEPSEKQPQVALPFTPKIVLFQALPKGAKLDLIVRQAAEFAVDEIVPFVSSRSINRNSAGGATGGNARLERLRRIVREARQQSGSTVDTRIHEILDFESALNYRACLEREAPFLSLCFSPQGEQGAFHKLREWKQAGGIIALFIGPEGGFSSEEEERFAALGFKFLSLGATILRCETAAVAAISVVRAGLEGL